MYPGNSTGDFTLYAIQAMGLNKYIEDLSMKKILLMTMGTALLGSAAIAEGVSISGSAGMGVIHMDKSVKWISDFDVGFSASGTTDGGLTFGAAAKMKASGNGDSVVGNSNVYVSGEAWTISIGDLDPATHMARPLPDVGYDGLGVDNIAEGAVGSTPAQAKVSFTLGNATLGITTGHVAAAAESYEPIATNADTTDVKTVAAVPRSNEWAVGLNVDAGGMSFGAGADSQDLVAFSAKASMGGISTVLYYAKDENTINDTDGYDTIAKQSGLGVSASFDASDTTTVSIVWAQQRETYLDGGTGTVKTDSDGVGIGISTNLGGGATLQAGIAKVEDVSAVSAGITMAF